MHDSLPIEIHDDGPTHWVPSEWIERGLKYPSEDTPEVILNARRQVLTLPRPDLLPAPSTPILAFLAIQFPRQIPSLVIHQQSVIVSRGV